MGRSLRCVAALGGAVMLFVLSLVTHRAPMASAAATATFDDYTIKHYQSVFVDAAGLTPDATAKLQVQSGATWVTIAFGAGGNVYDDGTLYDYFDVPPTMKTGTRLFRISTGSTHVDISATVSYSSPPVADAGSDDEYTAWDDGKADVFLDGFGSSDSDYDIVKYVWTEGTKQLSTDEYPDIELGIGKHTIKLTVTDGEGQSDSDTVVITVDNEPPYADAGYYSDATFPAGKSSVTVQLDGTKSYAYNGATIKSYVWKQDGKTIATGSKPKVVFGVAGVHHLVLTVTDSTGASSSASATLRVLKLPVANAGADQSITTTGSDATFTLNGSKSTAPSGTVAYWDWYWGETYLGSGETLQTSLPTGRHTVTLRVTDSNYNVDTDTVAIIITKTTPTVSLSTYRTTVNNWVRYSISGYPAKSTVTITWKRLSGSTIAVGTVTTDGNGSASGEFRVPATPGGAGQLITFAAGKSTESVSFEVAPRIKVLTSPAVRGKTIEVSLRGYSRDEIVRIRWKNSKGQWIQVGTATTSNTGSANVDITVPSWVPDGDNSVRGDGAIFRQQTNTVLVQGGAFKAAAEEPAATVTPTPKPAKSPTATPTGAPAASGTPGASPSAIVPATSTPSPSPTQSPALTATPTVAPSVTPAVPATPTATPSPTEAPSATPTLTPTDTPSATPTPTDTPTEAPTSTPPDTPSPTETAVPSPTETPSATPTPAVQA